MNEILEQYLELEKQEKELKEKKDLLKVSIEEEIAKNNYETFKNDKVTVSYTKPTKRVSVDNDLLKTKYENIYLECLKETEVKGSLRITPTKGK